jgi:hypothetical protein
VLNHWKADAAGMAGGVVNALGGLLIILQAQQLFKAESTAQQQTVTGSKSAS